MAWWDYLLGNKPVEVKYNARVEGNVTLFDVSDSTPAQAENLINNLKKEKVKMGNVKMPDCVPDVEPESWKTSSLCHVNGDKPLRGIVTVYVDVGQLPPVKAEAFVERVKDAHKDLLDRFPQDIGVMYIPMRPGSGTRMDYMPLDLNNNPGGIDG